MLAIQGPFHDLDFEFPLEAGFSSWLTDTVAPGAAPGRRQGSFPTRAAPGAAPGLMPRQGNAVTELAATDWDDSVMSATRSIEPWKTWWVCLY
jgi:hypothetical protein